MFLTVTDADKAAVVGIASQLHDLGFRIVATRGTAAAIKRMGIPVETINKIQDGSPHVVDWIDRGDVDLVINTPTGTAARSDGYEIRRAAVARGVPCITTIAGGMAAARAIAAARVGEPPVVSLQELHATAEAKATPPPAAAPRGPGPGCDADARAARTPPGGGRRVPPRRRVRHPRLRRPGRPRPDPGQFYMLAAAERWGGGADERPFLPRAFTVMRRATRRLEFMLEDVGPGTTRLGELRAGDGLWIAGPFGNGFAPPRDGRRPLLVGGGVGTAPLAIWQDTTGAERASRSASATRRTPRARRCCPTRASRPTTAPSATRARSPTCCSRNLGGRPSRRGLCLRSARDAGGRARDLRRARDPGPARARVRHGVRLRRLLRLRRADQGRLRAAVRRRAGARRATLDQVCTLTFLDLAAPVINASGTFDAIAARRAFGDTLLEQFPFAAFVTKTVTLAPRQGNPPPRLYELPAGLLNSIGLPNKGLDGFLAQDLPQLAELPVPLIVNVMGDTHDEVAELVERSASATRSPRSSSTSPARTSRPG